MADRVGPLPKTGHLNIFLEKASARLAYLTPENVFPGTGHRWWCLENDMAYHSPNTMDLIDPR